ncbi:hypothetical protein [Streptomyces syringium]|uniref:hypothetical protein n=1 Tax=Streptomyces syringium TaxID=76729 RepID=UPI003433895B
MNEATDHPEAAQLVDSLVSSEGGLLSYDFGAPGRQIAMAAGAHLAARSGTSLTVIDFRHLVPQIHATVAGLHPDLPCTPMSIGEAIQFPERATGGVLVLHTDLLHDPGSREALLARAAAADRLIVVSPAGVDRSLIDALPAPRAVMKAHAVAPPAPPAVGHADGVTEVREHQEPSREELAEAVQNAGPDELRRRIARVQEQRRQRAIGYPAPESAQLPTRDHGQEQSAAQQQQGYRGVSLT